MGVQANPGAELLHLIIGSEERQATLPEGKAEVCRSLCRSSGTSFGFPGGKMRLIGTH